MSARLAIAGLLALAAPAAAQQPPAEGFVLAAARVRPTAAFKIYNPAGSLRIVGWNRDSVVVRGRERPPKFFFNRDSSMAAVKGGVDQLRFDVSDSSTTQTTTPYHLTFYVPERSTVAVRTASADIDGTDVSGFFYSASGAIQLRGTSSNLEIESINGSIVVDATVAWMRARTGQGRVLIRGLVQDVDASTIDGDLDVASPSILRGRFSSVSGDIRYAASPARGSIFEFSNHGGAVDFLLPRTVSGVFELSSVTGAIENGFTQVQPAAITAHSLRLNLGRGEAQVTVRTFKGAIRLRPQP